MLCVAAVILTLGLSIALPKHGEALRSPSFWHVSFVNRTHYAKTFPSSEMAFPSFLSFSSLFSPLIAFWHFSERRFVCSPLRSPSGPPYMTFAEYLTPSRLSARKSLMFVQKSLPFNSPPLPCGCLICISEYLSYRFC